MCVCVYENLSARTIEFIYVHTGKQTEIDCICLRSGIRSITLSYWAAALKVLNIFILTDVEATGNLTESSS